MDDNFKELLTPIPLAGALFLLMVHGLTYMLFKSKIQLMFAITWVINLAYLFIEKNKGLLSQNHLFELKLNVAMNMLQLLVILAISYTLSKNKITALLLSIALTSFSIMTINGYAIPLLNLPHETASLLPNAILSLLVFLTLSSSIMKAIAEKEDKTRSLICSPEYIKETSTNKINRTRVIDEESNKEEIVLTHKSRFWLKLAALVFLIYGTLQLSYPFLAQVTDVIQSVFILGALLKFVLALAFGNLLRIESKRRELQLKVGNMAIGLTTLNQTIEHEMRPLLSSLQKITKILREKYNHDTFVKRQCDALKQLQSRMKTVTDVLLIMRETDVDFNKKSKQCNIGTLVDKAVKQSKDYIGTSCPQIIVERGTAKLYVQGIENRLVQVFTNLINNAVESLKIRYGTEKMPAIRLVCKKNKEERNIEVKVIDKGIGIAGETSESDKIFEPYFSTKEVKNNANTGIGLFIVKMIITSHGGQVSVYSNRDYPTIRPQDIKTEFTVTLPMKDKG